MKFLFLQSLRLASQATSLYTREALSTARKVIGQIFTKYVYKQRDLWYNSCAKQKTNNDLKENALFLQGVLYPFALFAQISE